MTMALLALIVLVSADSMRRALSELARIRYEQKLRPVLRRLRKPVQPWVTVIIYRASTSDELEKTLTSLRYSRYHAYDVVVVGPRAKTYQTAYRKSKRGKIIVCLPAGQTVDPGFIKRAVAMQQGRRTWRVALNEPVRQAEGLVGIVMQLRAIIWGKPALVDVCTSAALRNKRIEPTGFSLAHYSAELTQATVVAASVTAVIIEGWDALWYIWLLVSVYLFMLVWIRYDVVRKARLRVSFAIPSALFLLPVASVIQGVFQLYSRK